MKKIIFYSTIAFISSIGTASAALSHYEGNIANHNDVVTVSFTLANDASNVRLWTDSYKNGLNFDPLLTLWNQSTGAWIRENDDNSSVASGQALYDSGLILPNLVAGNYFFTITTSPNYANYWPSHNITGGFAFDAETPIPLASWGQPDNGASMGTYWSINLESITAIPVPAAIWLFGSAIVGFAGVSRRKTAAV